MQMPNYDKEKVDISPGTDEFVKAFEELVDYIVLSVSKVPRLETLLFQGKEITSVSDKS